MIIWLTGNTGSGKTTLAKKIQNGQSDVIILDGDEMRNIWKDLSMDKEDREIQCFRVARLAKTLSLQGFTIIIAVIAPYEDLRQEIQKICNCHFVYLEAIKAAAEDEPYEIPQNPLFTVSRLS